MITMCTFSNKNLLNHVAYSSTRTNHSVIERSNLTVSFSSFIGRGIIEERSSGKKITRGRRTKSRKTKREEKEETQTLETELQLSICCIQIC